MKRLLIEGALWFASRRKSDLASMATITVVCHSKLLNVLGPRIPLGTANHPAASHDEKRGARRCRAFFEICRRN